MNKLAAFLLWTSLSIATAQSNAPAGNGPAADPMFNIQGADLDTALNVYANAKGRTLLVHPGIKFFTVSLQAADKEAFVRGFERFLQDNQILPIPDGEKFVDIIPASFEKTFLAARQSLAAPAAASEEERPGYTLNYKNVSTDMVMDVYTNMVKRTWTSGALPQGEVTLTTEKPLTKKEVIHAFDVMFLFNGSKVVYVGDDAFKFVPL